MQFHFQPFCLPNASFKLKPHYSNIEQLSFRTHSQFKHYSVKALLFSPYNIMLSYDSNMELDAVASQVRR